MSQFLGNHQNRLDAKGRVSIPAAFRAALKTDEGASSLVFRPAHTHRCIEAWPGAVFGTLTRQLDGLELFSAAHEDLAAVLYADAYPLAADKEGRVLLPEILIAHAGLSDSVVFMGLGKIFQIWEPAAAAARREAARERARAGGLTLPPAPAVQPHMNKSAGIA